MIGAPEKPKSWRNIQEEFSGVKFVDVGRTPVEEYQPPVPPIAKPRTVTGKVIEVLLPTVVRVRLSPRFGKDEEFSVVVQVGIDTPKIGNEVEVEINGGVAVLRKDFRK